MSIYVFNPRILRRILFLASFVKQEVETGEPRIAIGNGASLPLMEDRQLMDGVRQIDQKLLALAADRSRGSYRAYQPSV